MITIKNKQRKIKVDSAKLHEEAEILLRALRYQDYDLGILLTTNATIRKFNKQYRQKDRPTDILSFSHHPTLQAGERIAALSDEDKNLGDLIISLEYVVKEAQKYGVSFEQRMRVLLVHGICHLLGYDHIQDADYKIMHRKELSLLRILKQSDRA